MCSTCECGCVVHVSVGVVHTVLVKAGRVISKDMSTCV